MSYYSMVDIPRPGESDEQRAARLKREAEQDERQYREEWRRKRRRRLRQQAAKFVKQLWKNIKGAVEVVVWLITILLGLKALGLI